MRYAGIGGRQTPPEVLDRMTAIARSLSDQGWTLHSGGAIGADSAFAVGAGTRLRIFGANHATGAAEEIASRFHPNWAACKPFARALHGRNVLILLGEKLCEPVEFVLAWTPFNRDVGGTGNAIRIAQGFGIPVFNLADERCPF